jgi:hypothetical protein
MKLGIYRHYKGNEYQVIGIARNTETLEELVIYREMKDNGKWWARPLSMFEETVIKDGIEKPRFEFIRD